VTPHQTRRALYVAGSGVVIAAALALFACGGQPEQAPPPRPVKVLSVGTASVAPVVELAGDVRARVESRLGFRVAGKIVARRVEAGQRVKRGDELARIDPRDYQLARTAADSQRSARRADVELAQAEYKRFADLREQGYVSDQELERKRTLLAAAEASLRQAESSASLEGNRLGDTVLRADADGVITRVDADVGEVVEAGKPVITLAQDGARDIVVEFPEDRTALARIATARVALWAQPGQEFPARLREMSAAADPVTRTFRARYSVQAPAGALALGQSATLRLTLPMQKGGARLPTTALVEQGGITQVWVFDAAASEVKRVPVQIAGLDGNDVVVAGLPDGAQVVVAGVHMLAEGQKVRALGSTAAAAPATKAAGKSGAAP
jgi:multidrug efflux system membrane fusion protein